MNLMMLLTLSSFVLSTSYQTVRTIMNKSNVNKMKLYNNELYRGCISLINNQPISPILISVEGNIGSGKTTILNELRNKHPEWTFIDEPVDIWSNLKTDNHESLLEVFYKDRKRWSYTFQNCALLTRYQIIEETINYVKQNHINQFDKHIFLTERCLDTDHQVFTKMLRAEGSIDKLELNLYEMLLSHLKKAATPVTAIIHVDTPPDVCFDRIKIRSRSGEESIPLDYLISLDNYQCKWVDGVKIPVHKTGEFGVEEVEKFITQISKSLSRQAFVE